MPNKSKKSGGKSRKPARLPAPEGPVVCKQWCVYGDGHGDAAFAADQTCLSVDHEIGSTGVGVSVMYTHASDQTIIAIGDIHGGGDCDLSVGDARTLGKMLRAMGDAQQLATILLVVADMVDPDGALEVSVAEAVDEIKSSSRT